MKKKYNAPDINIEKILINNIIAVSINIGEEVQTGVASSGKRRGEWGDLWSE